MLKVRCVSFAKKVMCMVIYMISVQILPLHIYMTLGKLISLCLYGIDNSIYHKYCYKKYMLNAENRHIV